MRWSLFFLIFELSIYVDALRKLQKCYFLVRTCDEHEFNYGKIWKHERAMEITRFPFLFFSWFSRDFHGNHERTQKRKPDDVDFARFPNVKVVLRPVHMHTLPKNKTKLEISFFPGSLEISKSFFLHRHAA